METQTSPYLDARRSWDERYGDQISRARNWRVACFLALGALVISASSNVLQLRAAKFSVWIVGVDHTGQIVASGSAERPEGLTDRLKRAALARWVGDLRGVTSDAAAERQTIIERVYPMIGRGTSAETAISAYYRAHSPFERAKTETVEVQPLSVVPVSDKTYEVEWSETARAAMSGETRGTERWKGVFTVAVNPPANEAEARRNVLGLYVVEAAWSQVLEKEAK